MKKRIYITKFTLTDGILELSKEDIIEHTDNGIWFVYPGRGVTSSCSSRHVFKNRTKAVLHAKKIIEKKVQSLLKQINRVKEIEL